MRKDETDRGHPRRDKLRQPFDHERPPHQPMQTRVLVFTGGALILLGVGGILIILRAREVDTVADGGGAFADNRSIPEVIKNTASQAIAVELQTLYQVKKGDNLFGIAKRFGVSVRAIKDANHDKHDILAVDQWLVIPK